MSHPLLTHKKWSLIALVILLAAQPWIERGGMARAQTPTTTPAPTVTASEQYDVLLASLGYDKLAVLRAIHKANGQGLREASFNLLPPLPGVMLRGVSRQEADQAVARLAAAGATARVVETPFLFMIESLYVLPGRGTHAVGRVLRGHLQVNTQLALYGLNAQGRKVTIDRMWVNSQLKDTIQAGDQAHLHLYRTNLEDVQAGMLLAMPGSITERANFNAEVYVPSRDEGGLGLPLADRARLSFLLHGIEIPGTLYLLPEDDELELGSYHHLSVILDRPLALERGMWLEARAAFCRPQAVPAGDPALSGRFQGYNLVP